jgi:hypothetical protein
MRSVAARLSAISVSLGSSSGRVQYIVSLEIGAILAVSTIGAFITFGATEAAADALAAGLAASAANWIADIGAADWIAQLGIDLSTTVGLISDTAADAVAGTTGAWRAPWSQDLMPRPSARSRGRASPDSPAGLPRRL